MKNFGKLAIDKVTGFQGIITAVTYYLYGCAQYCLTPKVDNNGKTQDNHWFDEGRLEIIGEGVSVESVRSEKPGCETREHGTR